MVRSTKYNWCCSPSKLGIVLGLEFSKFSPCSDKSCLGKQDKSNRHVMMKSKRQIGLSSSANWLAVGFLHFHMANRNLATVNEKRGHVGLIKIC